MLYTCIISKKTSEMKQVNFAYLEDNDMILILSTHTYRTMFMTLLRMFPKKTLNKIINSLGKLIQPSHTCILKCK